MNQVCTPSTRWFQAYSPQHYTHYLKIKCLSEWSLGTYEKIYVRLDNPIPKTHVNSVIASAKHALKLAKRFKTEAADFPFIASSLNEAGLGVLYGKLHDNP